MSLKAGTDETQIIENSAEKKRRIDWEIGQDFESLQMEMESKRSVYASMKINIKEQNENKIASSIIPLASEYETEKFQEAMNN